MIEFIQARPHHMADIVDFADFVFSKAHGPHDFASLCPKLYGPGKDTSGLHYLAVEYGKIKGVVCSMVSHMQVGGHRVTIGHIGTVCTHPAVRGKGYMQQLMAMADADLRQQGAHLALLDGFRDRYRHFGYEKTGTKHLFTMGDYYRDSYSDQLRLVPMADIDRGQVAFGLYQRNPLICRTEDTMLEILSTWHCQPHYIFLGDSLIGYLSGTDREIREILLSTPAALPAAAALWCQLRQVRSVVLNLPPYDLSLVKAAASAAWDCQTAWHNNYKIYDFAAVVSAFGNLHPGLAQMDARNWVLGIGAQRLELALSHGVFTAYATDKSPQWQFDDAMAAAQGLFSPLTVGNRPSILPLPLFVSDLDCC